MTSTPTTEVDVTFLKSEIVGRRTMPRDQRVEFELGPGPKGVEAVEVRRVDDDHEDLGA